MKYTLVLDSSASLPEFVIKNRPIKILPISITINGREFPDHTSEAQLLEVYASGEISTQSDIDTTSPTGDQIADFIIKTVVPNYDFGICQTVSKAVSPIYDSFVSVAHQINGTSREIRNRLNIDQPFRMTYMSSGNTVAGQGLIALYADVILNRGVSFVDYQPKIEKFKTLTKGFAIVKDVVYARHRGKMRGVKTVSLPAAMITKAVGIAPTILISNDVTTPVAFQPGFEKAVDRLFKYASDRITEGLYFPMINISIAGPKEELENFPEFDKLKAVAKKANVKILVGVMSLAACINYAPGTIALGIAPKNQQEMP